ncbi:hypothetical protein OG985_26775 [Streptomyces sp. NBC_00289]|uniref:terpene synthase family protein n=1 Tax=Streptomyces sp. NBC_00289 TaxID=2975703 RepID=UPI003248999E
MQVLPDIYMPLPQKPPNSSVVAEANKETRRWIDEFHLCPTADVRQAVADTNAVQCMALFYPEIDTEKLILLGQFVTLGFMIDDEWAVSNPQDVLSRLVSLLGVIEGDGDPSDSSGRAFAGVWQRILKGRPEVWRSAYRRNVVDHLWGQYGELVDKASGRWPELWAYQVNRRHTFGMEFLLDQCEMVADVYLPEVVRRLPAMACLREAIADHQTLVNDIISVSKEEGDGDYHNFILLTESHESIARQVALDKANAVATKLFKRVITAREELTDQLKVLPITDQERRDASRIADDYLVTVRANYDYYFDSMVRRYDLSGSVIAE